MAIVKKDSSSQQIVDYIIRQIETRELKPGDKLMNERNFAEFLGVSRVPLREAICALTNLGIVDVKPGGGTFVSKFSPNTFGKLIYSYSLLGSDKTSEIFEARLYMEADIARIAAEKARPDDILKIEQAIKHHENSISDFEKGILSLEEMFILNDRVHMAIAEASHNDFFFQFVDAIRKASIEQHLYSSHYTDTAWSFRRAAERHWNVCRAINSKKPENAYNEMFLHGVQVESDAFSAPK